MKNTAHCQKINKLHLQSHFGNPNEGRWISLSRPAVFEFVLTVPGCIHINADEGGGYTQIFHPLINLPLVCQIILVKTYDSKSDIYYNQTLGPVRLLPSSSFLWNEYVCCWRNQFRNPCWHLSTAALSVTLWNLIMEHRLIWLSLKDPAKSPRYAALLMFCLLSFIWKMTGFRGIA